MKLRDLIEQYVAFRRTLGEACVTNGRVLRAFGRSSGACIAVTAVRAEQVDAFLSGGRPITSAWHVKNNALRGFYRYAISRGYVRSAPLPVVLPKRPPAFIPYIYSRNELRRILGATDSYQRCRSRNEPITVRTMLLLMFGAALRSGEVIALNRSDVDLERCILTVRRSKFFKTRLVPFAPQLRRPLVDYARGRPAGCTGRADAPFFATRDGSRICQNTLECSFRRICERAGVRRTDGARYQPRLHDLRHTAAVHRLVSWYRQGLDAQLLLPMLSVYMGHAHLAATQVYLTMSPELLREASALFERYATGGISDD